MCVIVISSIVRKFQVVNSVATWAGSIFYHLEFIKEQEEAGELKTRLGINIFPAGNLPIN